MKIILDADEPLPVELVSALKQAGYHVDLRLLPNLPGHSFDSGDGLQIIREKPSV